MGICKPLSKGFGIITLKTHVLAMVSVLMVLGCTGPQREERPLKVTTNMAINKLASEISKSLPLERQLKIAVVDLLGPNDNQTQLGSFISKKLSRKLFVSGRFEKVLEQKLLRDLLMQQKIEMEQYFDQDTVKSVCEKIGIDAMVMGFITDCGSRVDLNVRLIDTKGEILSVADAQIDRDQVQSMLRGVKKATLTVAVDPADVEAVVTTGDRVLKSIDGTAVFRDLPQGKRSIIVTAKGYKVVQKSVYLTDSRAIALPLTPRRVTLTLRIAPPQGEIVFDGESKGKASQGVMVLRDVPSGKHTVLARAEGYLPETREIELCESKTISMELLSNPLMKIMNLKQDKLSFNIDIWTDKETYRLDEEIGLYFRSDKDCYVTLIDYEPNGNVKILFPNRYNQNNFVKAGKTYVIPGSEYSFKLNIVSPTGIETIKAIATTKPLSLFELDFSRDFFPQVDRTNTRGMVGISIALDRLADYSWAEDTCTINIRASW
jgi:hypothetical protein